MTCSVDSSLSLFPVTPITVQWHHEQSGHHGNKGDYGWVQQHVLTRAKATWLETMLSAQMPNLSALETNTEPPVWDHFPECSA